MFIVCVYITFTCFFVAYSALNPSLELKRTCNPSFVWTEIWLFANMDEADNKLRFGSGGTTGYRMLFNRKTTWEWALHFRCVENHLSGLFLMRHLWAVVDSQTSHMCEATLAWGNVELILQLSHLAITCRLTQEALHAASLSPRVIVLLTGALWTDKSLITRTELRH